jgi:hypothetical protein
MDNHRVHCVHQWHFSVCRFNSSSFRGMKGRLTVTTLRGGGSTSVLVIDLFNFLVFTMARISSDLERPDHSHKLFQNCVCICKYALRMAAAYFGDGLGKGSKVS